MIKQNALLLTLPFPKGDYIRMTYSMQSALSHNSWIGSKVQESRSSQSPRLVFSRRWNHRQAISNARKLIWLASQERASRQCGIFLSQCSYIGLKIKVCPKLKVCVPDSISGLKTGLKPLDEYLLLGVVNHAFNLSTMELDHADGSLCVACLQSELQYSQWNCRQILVDSNNKNHNDTVMWLSCSISRLKD